VKFELTPPDNDYALPLVQWRYREDQDYLPVWYNRENAETEARKVLPLWAKTHLVTEDETALDLSGKEDLSLIVLAKNVVVRGQRGGEVLFLGNSTGTSKGMQGGKVWFRHNSTGTSEGMQGGLVRFCHSSTGTSKGMQGGTVWFYDHSTGMSKGMQGGEVWFYDSSTGTSKGMQGGRIYGNYLTKGI
jgi:hypothetical protein